MRVVRCWLFCVLVGWSAIAFGALPLISSLSDSEVVTLYEGAQMNQSVQAIRDWYEYVFISSGYTGDLSAFSDVQVLRTAMVWNEFAAASFGSYTAAQVSQFANFEQAREFVNGWSGVGGLPMSFFYTGEQWGSCCALGSGFWDGWVAYLMNSGAVFAVGGAPSTFSVLSTSLEVLGVDVLSLWNLVAPILIFVLFAGVGLRMLKRFGHKI